MRLSALFLLVMASTPATAGDIWVSFLQPKNGDQILGEVDLVVQVVAEMEVAEVEIVIDGRPSGVLYSSPYRLRVDLGEQNLPHRFEVIARDVEGGEARHQVTTQPVPISGEIEVELQQLYVTVDRDGEVALGLEREDFEVIDKGEPQSLVTFARGNIPFTAVLLIDVSASMYGKKLEAALAGAASFVRGMNNLDQAQMMVFSDQAHSVTPLTSADAVLTASLGISNPGGGTALCDHFYVALKLLEQRQGRRVVVVLSDGVDGHSILSMDEVFQVARRSQALIYWIGLGRGGDTPAPSVAFNMTSSWRSAEQYQAQLRLLEETVRSSGGRIITIDSPSAIESVFVEILEELREQYVLGYYPSNRLNNGSWHPIRVKVRPSGLEVRTHRGYVDR